MGSHGMPYGLQAMLKDGYKHLSGVDEAVLKNIEACKELCKICRTSMGPNGMNKLIVNHLDKLFVSSDASVIVNELEIQHPAAKMVTLAARAQDTEIGDGTNFVVSFAGELLSKAEDLLRQGLHPGEIADGYEAACKQALQEIEALIIPDTEKLDVRDPEAVARRLKGSIASKQQGYETQLAKVIAQACIHTCPKNPANFDVDNVRVTKVVGGGLGDSSVVQGMLFGRPVEGRVSSARNAKVAVYAQGVDTANTESKGTVLLHSAKELESYSRSEEDTLEAYVKKIADAGVGVVVSGTTVGEMAIHFLDKYDIMLIKIPSKFDMRRFCRATGAAALPRLQVPRATDLGFAKSIDVQEIGGDRCIVLQQDDNIGQVATILLRGATEGILSDVERAIDDGVNTYRALAQDARMLPGGGAPEIAMCRLMREFGKGQTGLEQYAIIKYAEAFEVVPRTLAENSGINGTTALATLHAAHAAGNSSAGLDLDTAEAVDLTQQDIMDLYRTKWWAVRLASNAVVTVLRVDHIIMAKQAGGPQPRGPGGDED